ncbi:hypothetical protein [Acinetobacter bouvetii]|uniref:Uncharacterized protein n=1 Tax=Acinetobacter bouvetii TaxID=202951 RepID=A0A811GAQ1_9GAMM|nr:hypothetical protein [Acinetobacter bouvetii]CAB1209853.1 hypothetical protein SFB21_0638 [Acinetobacter bouvetii]
MDILKNNFFVVIIILVSLGLGVLLDYFSGNYGFFIKNINYLDDSGKVKQLAQIDIPVAVQILKLGANFLYALAITIFITIYISRNLENKQKQIHEEELKKLSQEINQNVFSGLFRKLIPDEIFEIIKTDIIENKAIRKKAHWNFVFEEVEDNKIKLISTTHYELHNISSETISDPVRIEIDPLASTEMKARKAICVADGKCIVNYDASTGQSENIVIEDRENGAKTISYSLNVEPKNFITSTFEYETIYSDSVYDSQTTKYPIIDLNINTMFPKGYKFSLHPSLSSELKIVSEGDTHQNFKVEGGILPRQGVIFVLQKI